MSVETALGLSAATANQLLDQHWEAVSYTHLDVYKRQAVARAEGDRAESSRVVADTILRQRDAEGPIDPDARSSDLIESHGWAPRGPR